MKESNKESIGWSKCDGDYDKPLGLCIVFRKLSTTGGKYMADEPKNGRKAPRRRRRKGAAKKTTIKKGQKITLLIPDLNKLSRAELQFIANYKA
jgi:hypothetical protein